MPGIKQLGSLIRDPLNDLLQGYPTVKKFRLSPFFDHQCTRGVNAADFLFRMALNKLLLQLQITY